MKSLVWFRSDLRLEDNPALFHACRDSAAGLIAVFLISPNQWRSHDWGARKIAYLLQSLESLGKDLAAIGIPLVMEEAPGFSDAPKALEELLERHRCKALYFNREYEFNEATRDELLESRLQSQGIEVRAFDDQMIVQPGTIRTQKGEPYSVFTPFWRNWSKHLENQPPAPLPRPAPLGADFLLDFRLPEFAATQNTGSHSDSEWTVGETAAKEQLMTFLASAASGYHRLRDDPSAKGTSRLSAALAVGALSPRTCLDRAISANDGFLTGDSEGIQAWIRQLAWRDFYRQVLISFPRVSRGRSFLEWTERVEWRDSPHDFNAWKSGQTGVPLVDAGMRQLRETGWLHNRVRMVTAMYLAKDLLLDWRQGEAHFMRELVDGDFANNNGGWQWSASTGVDAAPYFRIMNPWTQAKRFDPYGEYIKTWVPEISQVAPRSLHDPKKLTELIHAGLDYPEPLVDHRAARIRAVTAFERAK